MGQHREDNLPYILTNQNQLSNNHYHPLTEHIFNNSEGSIVMQVFSHHINTCEHPKYLLCDMLGAVQSFATP